MDISGELERLEQLRRTGVLSEVEFQQAKQQVLNGQTASPSQGVGGGVGNGAAMGHGVSGGLQNGVIHGLAEGTWCTLMHLSQLLVFAGGVGIVAPILMWAISKDQSEMARRHGARMMNWLISSFIYAIISGLLVLVLIGVPLVILVLILTVVFPVMAALKANNGELWSYPMAIKFLDED